MDGVREDIVNDCGWMVGYSGRLTDLWDKWMDKVSEDEIIGGGMGVSFQKIEVEVTTVDAFFVFLFYDGKDVW